MIDIHSFDQELIGLPQENLLLAHYLDSVILAIIIMYQCFKTLSNYLINSVILFSF